MKPFNLEAAKRGEPICTEDNKPLHFICFDEVSNKIVYGYDGRRVAYTDLVIAETCIFMAPKTRTVWLNYFQLGRASVYNTKEDADRMIIHPDKRIGGKAYPVEIEE